MDDSLYNLLNTLQTVQNLFLYALWNVNDLQDSMTERKLVFHENISVNIYITLTAFIVLTLNR